MRIFPLPILSLLAMILAAPVSAASLTSSTNSTIYVGPTIACDVRDPTDDDDDPVVAGPTATTSCSLPGIASTMAMGAAALTAGGKPALAVYADASVEPYEANFAVAASNATAVYEDRISISGPGGFYFYLDFLLTGSITKTGQGLDMDPGNFTIEVRAQGISGTPTTLLLREFREPGEFAVELVSSSAFVVASRPIDIVARVYTDAGVFGGLVGPGDIRSGTQVMNFASTLVLRDIVVLDEAGERIFVPIESELGANFTTVVPLPGAFVLLLTGLAGLAGVRRRH